MKYNGSCAPVSGSKRQFGSTGRYALTDPGQTKKHNGESSRQTPFLRACINTVLIPDDENPLLDIDFPFILCVDVFHTKLLSPFSRVRSWLFHFEVTEFQIS
jgi:hypothetical protein